MAKIDATRFLELLRLSQLVDESKLTVALEQSSSEAMQDADALANHLVQSGVLSRWQADNILEGKHKGFRLGSYRLLGKLGRGGMSTVYLAEHTLMRRKAAIKVLPRKRVDDSSYLARFHREAQAAAALDHPNIVRIYDVTSDGNVHFIAMEYIDGQDLQTRVATEGRLDFDRVADYIAQAALGLHHAHSVGLIHRDIKPANLLANAKGIIKILDMGLAKFDEEDQDATSLTIAHDENVLGTVDYLAPEQAIDSHNVDQRADIYGLGCTMYFLLVGHPPFPEGSLAKRLMKHQKVKPTPILEKRPDTPIELVKICDQMMEKRPSDRTATAALVAEQLGAWLASRGRNITGDSGTGSQIGVAAGVIRELREAAELEVESDSPSSAGTIRKSPSGTRHGRSGGGDSPYEGSSRQSETEKDTTISRSQDETRKRTVPPRPLMPDELELAPLDDSPPPPHSLPPTPPLPPPLPNHHRDLRDRTWLG